MAAPAEPILSNSEALLLLRSIDARLARLEEHVGLTPKLDRADIHLLAQLLPAIVGAIGDSEFATTDLFDELGPKVVLRDCGRSVRAIGKLLARAAGKEKTVDGLMVERVAAGPPVRWRVTSPFPAFQTQETNASVGYR